MWNLKKHLAVIGLGLALAAGTVLADDRYRWEPDGFGGYEIYDENGNRVGRAEADPNHGDYRDYDTFDNDGNRTGRGEIDPSGNGSTYDNDGNRTGSLDSD